MDRFKRENLGRYGTVRVVLLSTVALCLTPGVQADVVIDPDGVGATQINDFFGDPADPTMTTLSDWLVIGDDAAGALLIDNTTDGNAVTNVDSRRGILGLQAGSDGQVTVSGVGAKWLVDDELTVGSSGSGELVIEAGGVVESAFGTVPANNGSSGVVTVRGMGSLWDNDSGFFIGAGGEGTVEIFDGGTINGGDAASIGRIVDGDMVVNGEGSTFNSSVHLEVGNVGTGTLTVENKAQVISFDSHIGFRSESTGVVTVHGDGSKWDNTRELFVGSGDSLPGPAQGSLSIEAGADVTSEDFYIGFNPNATGDVTVTGNGSTLDVNFIFRVGDEGMGTLLIDDGGVVNTNGGNIAGRPGSTGDVTVRGMGSKWEINGGLLDVGSGGAGSLTIEDGAQVSNGLGRIGVFSSASNGDVVVDGTGSTWTNTEPLVVGQLGPATLEIKNGGRVDNVDGFIGFTFLANSSVTVADAGSIWANMGDLYVGGNDGTLSAPGEGTLNIDPGGTVTNTHGYIAFLKDAKGDVTVQGTDATWTNNGDLQVGGEGEGTLTIEAGGRVSSVHGSVGHGTDSIGTATVDGTGSIWANSGNFYVGSGALAATNSWGMLEITNGGSVEGEFGFLGFAATSTGEATVHGNASAWTNNRSLFVGDRGDGTMNIQAGGTVTNADGIVGTHAGASGEVTVTGADSTWMNNGLLTVGGSPFAPTGGMGDVTIEDGGEVINNDGWIGYQEGGIGQVIVRDAGSKWTNQGNVNVGNRGDGTLQILNGAVVTGVDSTSAVQEGASGQITVSGDGSRLLMTGLVSVGHRDLGKLEIAQGGAVENLNGQIGAEPTGDGEVVVQDPGSTWTVHDSLYIGGRTDMAGGTGRLMISDEAVVTVNQALKVWAPGSVDLTGGTLKADVVDVSEGGGFGFLSGVLTVNTFMGSLFQDGGTLAPGESPGITEITQDYLIIGGTLEIDLGAVVPSNVRGGPYVAGVDFDQIQVGEMTALGGELAVSLSSGFTPAHGDVFEILISSEIVGEFDTYSGDVFTLAGSDIALVPVVDTVNDVVTVVTTAPGDANLDFKVDAGDLNQLALHWQQGGQDWFTGDFNGDGFVNAGDLNLLALNWQFGVGGLPSLVSFDDAWSDALAAAAVPEPSMWGLVGLGALTLLTRPKKNA